VECEQPAAVSLKLSGVQRFSGFVSEFTFRPCCLQRKLSLTLNRTGAKRMRLPVTAATLTMSGLTAYIFEVVVLVDWLNPSETLIVRSIFLMIRLDCFFMRRSGLP